MSYFKVAANGAAAIVSKTVIMAKESIDYKEVIGISKEGGKQRNPRPVLVAVGNTPILNKGGIGGDKLSEVMMKIISII